uniref:Uncharacterized protein n=1 Tax=Kalanchoe fedtschenkoi TaxID=63787 RepID=A0A7N1A488_KALFE
MGKKMGAPFSSISRWLWTGKNKLGPASNKSSPSECCSAGASKFVTYASPSSKGNLMTLNSRNGMRVDAEYDAVLVQPDADGISESESGELDWSIGWLESFSPEFQSDDENDGTYAVLVPCYKPGCMEVMEGPKPPFGNVIKGLSCDYSAEGRKYMEQWLSSLQGR